MRGNLFHARARGYRRGKSLAEKETVLAKQRGARSEEPAPVIGNVVADPLVSGIRYMIDRTESKMAAHFGCY